eukprot:Nitzschia sp. Nitz4//scaffold27_size158506//31127//31822//NITZ4_002583-RA/size158506-processed-gene-0.7-mRNA-1//1//CDS//3329545437//3890//frame0
MSHQSDFQRSITLKPNQEYKRHAMVQVPPGGNKKIDYVTPNGWRCVQYHLSVLQEPPRAGYYVEELRAGFGSSHICQRANTQNHLSNQGVVGPNVAMAMPPFVELEANLQLGHNSQHSAGSQEYTTENTTVTHDTLRLVASVPETYTEATRFGHKVVHVKESLRLQLEVIYEPVPPVTATTSSPSVAAPTYMTGLLSGQILVVVILVIWVLVGRPDYLEKMLEDVWFGSGD